MPLVFSVGADATFSDPGAGFESSVGKYWISCVPKIGEAPKQRIPSPGVNGVAVGRNSDAYPMFEATVAYVSNAANSDGGYAADLTALQNKKLTVETPQNGLFTGCELISMEALDPCAKETGSGTYMLLARIVFEQLRNEA